MEALELAAGVVKDVADFLPGAAFAVVEPEQGAPFAAFQAQDAAREALALLQQGAELGGVAALEAAELAQEGGLGGAV